MLAMILTINKIRKDNEAIIMWTAGLNKIHIVKLIFKISLIIMLVQLFFTSVVNPKMLGMSRNVIKNSELQFVPTLMKEKQFNDSVEGLQYLLKIKFKMENIKIFL